MAWQMRHYQPQRWMKFFYRLDGIGTDGFHDNEGAAAAHSISDIGFNGPWQLHNIVLRFSTLNVSDTSLEVWLIKKAAISMNLLSTHSLYVDPRQLLMNVSISDVTSIELRDSWGSQIDDFYFTSEDAIQIHYSMKSGINGWTLEVDGWAVLNN